MQKENTKFAASNLFEGMTSISALLNADPLVNDRKIERVLIDRSKQKSKSAEIGYLRAQAKLRGFALELVDAEQIDALTVGSSHGGILAFCSDRNLPRLTAEQIVPNAFYAYLEGIEDPYNFGNTLRSLYAAGVSGVVVPERNWMSAAGVVARASAGTSEKLPVFTADANTLVTEFHKASYQILSAGIRESVSIFEETFAFPILLVIGGEKRGISRTILEQSDHIVRIDYGREFRGSLSASASAAVLAFELFRQNKR